MVNKGLDTSSRVGGCPTSPRNSTNRTRKILSNTNVTNQYIQPTKSTRLRRYQRYQFEEARVASEINGNQVNRLVFVKINHKCIFTVRPNLRFYPYFMFFDVETWLKKTTQFSHGKLHYSGSHELLSISLMGNKETKAVFIPIVSRNHC
jgi:hypothetical protein